MKFARGVEYAQAYTGSALSWVSVRNRMIGARVIGDDEAITKLTYRVAATPSRDIRTWAHFSGVPGATKLPFPVRYPGAGITYVDPAAIDALQEAHPNAKPGIAWKFGHTVMYGLLPPGDTIPEKYAMRVGGGPLDTIPIVHEHQTNEVFAPDRGIDVSQVVDLDVVLGQMKIY